MKIIEETELLKKLIKAVELKQTGTPDNFAKKLGISRSRLYSLLEELKNLGVEIKYDRKNKNFHQVCECKIEINDPIIISGRKV